MKVKNNIRKIMLLLSLTVIVSGVSVYATYKYLASDVSYTKSDGTDVSVEEALNELYSKQLTIECIWNGTDNLVTPKSSLNFEKTMEHDGMLIVDMAAVEGNATLFNNWTHNLKINNTEINSINGFCNGWNGHYYYIVKVNTGDVLTIYSGVDFTANYNAVSVGGYLVY